MSVEYRVGDVRALLAEMPARSVDLIATSWPYLEQRDYLPKDHPMKAFEIGHEPTPAAYLDTLLGVTAEFRRVLAPYGSIATELGDKFSESGGAGGDYNANGLREGQPKFGKSGGEGWPLGRSMCMVPELYRVALAYGIHPLTGEPSPAARWRVRNVVVHGRPNPPVGSLGDKYRPACSYWAVACVNRRWFDLDAVRSPSDYDRPNLRGVGARAGNGVPGQRANHSDHTTNEAGAPPLDWFEDECDQFESDLWTIPTAPYKGAHYATFAPELVRRFIVSMCPPRVCQECGKPSKRITKALRLANGKVVERRPGRTGGLWIENGPGVETRYETLGWTDCGHNAWRPGLTLDPFGGSGTTGMVAAGNGRDALLFDLDERGLDLARERVGLYLAEQSQPNPEPESTDEQGVLL